MTIPRPGRSVRGSTSGRPIMAILDLLGRRWTLRILWELRHGDAMSFRDLQTICGDISPTSLNKRLQELKEAFIVQLTDGGYQLTQTGIDLLATLQPLQRWAEKWASLYELAGDNDAAG